MNKLFAPFLPPWAETGLQPAFYDLESGTVLQQTARMYDKVNQLIRLFNELSEETKTTVEEYIAKFIELKDFVDDYFENLDVQEEINNKLDDMAEQGQLADIISQYLNSTAIFGYDNVASMKTAENLVNGSYARTLGYYTKNDGGDGLYKIRNITNDDVVDNGSIIEIGDPEDHLVAELISSEINVKQFGAYGDGTHDDTTAIQNAINYLKGKYPTSNPFEDNLILNINGGKYLVTSTIQLPIIVRLNITEDSLILSNVANDTTIWINSGNLAKDTSLISTAQQTYCINSAIGGKGVLSIERNTAQYADVNDMTASSIAIEIGDRSYNASYLNVARSKMENVAVCGFATGIKINSYSFYLWTFERCKIESNRYNVIYGASASSNAGENIRFVNCVFGHSYNAFTNKQYAEFIFDGCSFDFNGNDILSDHPCHIVMNACHYEGIGFHQADQIETTDSNCNGFGTIVYVNYNSANTGELTEVEINNPLYYLASSNYKLIPRYQSKFNGSFKNLKIVHNSYEKYNEGGYNYNNTFMNTPNVVIEGFRTPFSDTTLPVIPFNTNDQVGNLDAVNNSTVSLDSLETNYMYMVQNLTGVTVDTSNKVFNKSLQFGLSSSTWFNIRRRIATGGAKKVTTTMWINPSLVADSGTYDHLACTVHGLFYNKNGIYTGAEVVLYLSQEHIMKDPDSDWYIIKPCVIDIPEGTQEILVSYNFTTKNSSDTNVACTGNIRCGGIVLDKLF